VSANRIVSSKRRIRRAYAQENRVIERRRSLGRDAAAHYSEKKAFHVRFGQGAEAP
jgi:hypothetical protein